MEFKRSLNSLNLEVPQCRSSYLKKFPHDGSINHSDYVLNDNTLSYSYKTVISELL